MNLYEVSHSNLPGVPDLLEFTLNLPGVGNVRLQRGEAPTQINYVSDTMWTAKDKGFIRIAQLEVDRSLANSIAIQTAASGAGSIGLIPWDLSVGGTWVSSNDQDYYYMDGAESEFPMESLITMTTSTVGSLMVDEDALGFTHTALTQAVGRNTYIAGPSNLLDSTLSAPPRGYTNVLQLELTENSGWSSFASLMIVRVATAGEFNVIQDWVRVGVVPTQTGVIPTLERSTTEGTLVAGTPIVGNPLEQYITIFTNGTTLDTSWRIGSVDQGVIPDFKVGITDETEYLYFVGIAIDQTDEQVEGEIVDGSFLTGIVNSTLNAVKGITITEGMSDLLGYPADFQAGGPPDIAPGKIYTVVGDGGTYTCMYQGYPAPQATEFLTDDVVLVAENLFLVKLFDANTEN